LIITKIMKIETDKLIHDLKNISSDAEELLKSAGGEINEKTKAVRHRLNGALQSAKESCEVLQERAIESIAAADQTIRRHPYQTLGIALGIGVLVGLVLRRDG
jgi:ElaB/YqjD/DUF883 family membrane-anchored ribosome-binding protein